MATIRTERLTLRPLELSDAARISAFTRDWDVARMVSSIPFPQPLISVEGFLLIEQARRPLERDWTFAIEIPGEGLIGMVGAHVRGKDYSGRFVEIGYWVGKPYWGKGYATEAARAVADFGAGLAHGPVMARHYADNPASGRVLEKAGFVYNGEQREGFSLARGGTAPSLSMERKALRKAA
jgi:RimJ/RimL family protein N-acetyltransferase